MLTPIEIAWFATYFYGGETEYLGAEMAKAVGGREYSPHEREAALRSVGKYRPEGDPVADPVFGSIAVIYGHTPYERVRDAAFAAFRGMLAEAAGRPCTDDIAGRTLLAALALRGSDELHTAAEARRTVRRLVDALSAMPIKEDQQQLHDPVQIAWALARIYAQDDWDGTAEPDHPLMQPVALDLHQAARSYIAEDPLTDPVLRTLSHMTAQFDAAQETGAGDVVLAAMRELIAKDRSYYRFALGLLVHLVQQRHTGELGVASARILFDGATLLARDIRN